MNTKLGTDSSSRIQPGTTSRVVVRGVKEQSIRQAVQECMEACDWESIVPSNASVVVKPNVCTAVPAIAGTANTSVEVTAAVCEVLRTRTSRIVIGESRHMRQTPWQSYAAAGYTEMAKALDVQLVNFSEEPTVECDCEPVGKMDLPKRILDCDVFITVPVLKTHALTYFTGTLKNQWGCVPKYQDRLQHHLVINELLSSLHRILNPRLSIMDGVHGMDGRGPVAGNVRDLGVILASRDGVALDATAMRLVGLDPQRCRHVITAGNKRLGHTAQEQIEIDGDFEKYETQFLPPPRDIANTVMFSLTRYGWFRNNIFGNDALYYPVTRLVKFVRRLGILGG